MAEDANTMTRHEKWKARQGDKSIAAALDTWDRARLEKRLTEVAALRAEFVDRFPIEAWPTMPLERYALGQEVEGGSYSWWLEFHTNVAGSMRGGSATKHLIWRSPDGTWRYPKQYSSVEEAWSAVREGIVEILALASEGRVEEADDVKALSGAAAVRSKTLFMYFPDDLLPISSKAHLDHFLRALGDPARDWSAIRANRHLLELLRGRAELATLSAQELGPFLYHWNDPRSALRVVKIAPGEGARLWEECLAGSFICVGWDDVGDLSEFADKAAFREAFAQHYPYNGNHGQVTRKANELWTLMELEPGDKVVANKGTSAVLAVGTVTEDGYRWRPERAEYRNTVGIDWDTKHARSIEPVKAWATKTVAKVPADLYKMITGSGPLPPPVEVERVYVEIEHAITRRGQVVLYGPPGTGKTYAARRAAVWLLDGGSTDPQAAKVLADDDTFVARETAFDNARDKARQVWFMVANPSQWSWSELFKAQTVEYSLGRLKRNYPRVRAGDLVVGYESTPTQRVVALATIVSEFDADGPPEKALTLEPVAPIADGPTWDQLREDPLLGDSEPMRFRCQGSLFALTPSEADRLLSLLDGQATAASPLVQPSIRRLTRLTFHPSYTYEDFVEGFRPQPSGAGGLELALADGIFKQMCAAAAGAPDDTYILLIDEINRGNIPKIFGELITLIEKDKRGLTTTLPQSGDDFQVPANLVIIATMNTADRSVHLLDTALRRRFAFVELLPDSELLAGATAGPLALDVFLTNLNDRIRERVGREKQVGHAIFYDEGSIIDTPDAFAAVFRHELLPLLQEYLYEDYSELADLLGTDVIDPSAARPTSMVDDPEALCTSLADQFGANA